MLRRQKDDIYFGQKAGENQIHILHTRMNLGRVRRTEEEKKELQGPSGGKHRERQRES